MASLPLGRRGQTLVVRGVLLAALLLVPYGLARAASGVASPVQTRELTEHSAPAPARPSVMPDRPGRTALDDEMALWRVGRQADGTVLTATNQWLRPAGQQVELPGGRPTSLRLTPDGRTLLIADRANLRVIDAASGELRATLGASGGHSVNGLVISRDGRRAYSSSPAHKVFVWNIDAAGAVTAGEPLAVPGSNPAPAGLALSADEQTLYVAASRSNAIVALPLAGGEPRTVTVGAAPFDLVRLGDKLYVTNWGGRLPGEGDRTQKSSGTEVRVDERTVANDGTVSVLDLASFTEQQQIQVGLLPSSMTTNRAGTRLYVVNGNSDTVSIIDTAADRVVGEVSVKPSERLPYGSSPTAVVLSPDEQRMYVALGANNAIAQFALAGDEAELQGFIPAAWYPGALALSANGQRLYVANIKGWGSLGQAERHATRQHMGTLSLIDLDEAQLPAWTQQVAENNRHTLSLAGLEPPRRGIAPAPLPERHGEPSLIKHVVYIIRENRTYDQVLGDMPEGRGDPSLTIYGEEVTPNSHKLARDFQLLDNFYCSGVLSADGHQWVDEGYVTSYLERSFGGFVRSYPGDADDPLAFSPKGFIWDNVLEHGLTFRNYGEAVKAVTKAKRADKPVSWTNIYEDFMDDGIVQDFEISSYSLVERVQQNNCDTVSGFPCNIPDVYRAGEFIKELKAFEETGDFPNLSMILLPCDHTTGLSVGYPMPASQVADNDLAVGQIVEAITKSKFWPETAIFICQDDSQDGQDHIDGHRSPGYVISPYTPRGSVSSTNYTQVSMYKTIELLLGLPPMHQLDLLAEPMRDCFVETPDFTPYEAVPNRIPLDDMVPPKEAMSPLMRFYSDLSDTLDFSEEDLIVEDTLNRILWYAARGEEPYPDWAIGRRAGVD